MMLNLRMFGIFTWNKILNLIPTNNFAKDCFSPHFNTVNHAVAAIKVPEEYEALRIALGNIRKEINDLITEGCLQVGDKTVEVEFFLGGDYKVQSYKMYLILLGSRKLLVLRQTNLLN